MGNFTPTVKVPFLIITALILLILAGTGGFYLGFTRGRQASPPPNQAVGNIPKEKFLSAQNAIFEGKILIKNNTSLTVESIKGERAKVVLDKDFSVYKFDEKSRDTKEYHGLDKIELNKPVHMLLTLKDGGYQVLSITYTQLPPLINNK